MYLMIAILVDLYQYNNICLSNLTIISKIAYLQFEYSVVQ